MILCRSQLQENPVTQGSVEPYGFPERISVEVTRVIGATTAVGDVDGGKAVSSVVGGRMAEEGKAVD